MLWAVVLIGIAARLGRYFLCFPLWEDEAMLGMNFLSRDYLGLVEALDNLQVAPPLFLWSVETLVNWFGFTEYTLRSVAFISGTAGLLLFVLANTVVFLDERPFIDMLYVPPDSNGRRLLTTT